MIGAEYVIHSDPERMGGIPVFVGTRVPLKNLLDYLAGSGLEAFLEDFPSVSREQAIAAIRQACEALVSKACPPVNGVATPLWYPSVAVAKAKTA